MPDFIPRQDSELLSWSSNLAAKIQIDPSRFSLTPEEVSNYLDLNQAFSDSYQQATSPTTRGPIAVSRKDACRISLVASARLICRLIRATPDLSDAERLGFGFKPKKTTLTRSGIPTSAPLVHILSTKGRTIDVLLSDNEAANRIAKPNGIKAALLFAHVGENPPARVFDWMLIGRKTRTRFTIELPAHATPGSKVCVAAVWENTRGKTGPCISSAVTYVGYALARRAA